MNYILTSSRTGSTIYGHSLNAALDLPIDIVKTDKLPTPVIGEHGHKSCSWEVKEILNSNLPATKIKPEFRSFREIQRKIDCRDRIIWFRRDQKSWIKSIAKVSLTQIHHCKTKEELNNFPCFEDFTNEEQQIALERGERITNIWLKKQLRVIQKSGTMTMLFWYEDLLKRPQLTINRSLNFFKLPIVNKDLGIYTPCHKLPDYDFE